MATDISWALKAVKMIYYRHEYDAAFDEFGLARVRFLNQVIQLAVENRNYPLPNQPGWIDFFTFILEGHEREFGPLGGPVPNTPGQAVTMTEHYGDEDWRAGFPE
jgi:hypothetical protein